MKTDIQYYVNMSDFNTMTSICYEEGNVRYDFPYPGNRFYKSTPNKISREKFFELKAKHFSGVEVHIYDICGRYAYGRKRLI